MSDSSKTPPQIFARAAALGQRLDLPYAGAMPPPDAFALQQARAAVIVDVRTRPELQFVGRVADAKELEWQIYPDMTVNDAFAAQLQQMVPPERPVLFLCRSGARSHHAAAAAALLHYRAYNILEGFEGDLNDARHRNKLNGWRARGLPWEQS